MTFKVGDKVKWRSDARRHSPLEITQVDARAVKPGMSQSMKDQLTRYTVQRADGTTLENAPGYLLQAIR